MVRSPPRILDAVFVLAALLVGTAALLHAGAMEPSLFEGLQAARRAAGVDELRRRGDLDDVARRQAAEIARRPHRQRLQFDVPIEDVLERSGVEDVRRAVLHVDLKRGHAHPERAVLEDRREYGTAWRNAMSGALDSAGLAFHQSDDGWIVVVVILAEEVELERLDDAGLRELEHETFEAVNEARRGRGLEVLRFDESLAEAARYHSADMANQGFFAHRALDGRDADARVRATGLSFRRLGENLHKSRGADHPVRNAVEAWMRSRGHRRTMLDPDYRHSAVGIAVDGSGTFYFTQLFASYAD